jgi:hypothetical protein
VGVALPALTHEPTSDRDSGTYRKGSATARCQPRVPINLPVELLTAEGWRVARCTELGLASLVLDVESPLAYGDLVEILLPGALHVSGVVRWNGIRGCGVQLVAPRAAAVHALCKVIRAA